MLQQIHTACFVALLFGFLASMPFLLRNVGTWSVLFWIWLPWPMKVFMPSGTEYDRMYENVPIWLKRTQEISLYGLVATWFLIKVLR
jgi:hypothetical protein